MSSLQELLGQKAALDKAIDTARKQQKSEAISKIRTLMSEYDLTVSDLSGKSAAKTGGTKGSKVAVKYRNTATGDTWSGRGLQPKWLKAALAAGRKIEDFAA